jgi:DNA-binding GntR family transcriptional regulator
MIVDGVLGAGEHVNEVHLAARLGASRTPLREALNRLVAEGALDARPRLGYFVKRLTLDEFDQLYDIRPLLDPEARVWAACRRLIRWRSWSDSACVFSAPRLR